MTLREWKKTNRFTYNEIAEKVGVSYQTIFQAINKPDRSMKVSTIVGLQKLTGLTYDEILQEKQYYIDMKKQNPGMKLK